MFDQGNEPQDIFAETESAKPPSGTTPGGSGRPGAPAGIDRGLSAAQGGVPAHGPSKLIFAVIALVVLGGIGAGAYFWFFRTAAAPAQEAAQTEEGTKDTTPTPEPTPVITEPAPEAPAPEATAPDATEPALPPDEAAGPVDTDGDGLDDSREALLGTDPSVTDTDADGLSDREEAVIYMTDPKNPDTDGDGFLDGQEVRGGYNPKGDGKLFGIPPATP
jgi:hypothetical protein